jgi:ribosome-associated protein
VRKFRSGGRQRGGICYNSFVAASPRAGLGGAQPLTKRDPILLEPLEDKRIQRVIEAGKAKKAFDLVLLDLREIVTYTDFFFLCSGNTSRQNQTICAHIEERLREVNARPLAIEGYREAEWILMDYSDLLVHIFTPEKREFYDLERLWIDARRISISDE